MSSPSAHADQAALKAGVAALKQADYGGAIALLRQVRPGHYHEQAQRALIVAYDKLERFEPAIALCYPLSRSSNPEMQAWAQKSLKKLKRRAKQQEEETAEAPTAVFEGPMAVMLEGADPPGIRNAGVPEIGVPNLGVPNPAAIAPGTERLRPDPRWRPLGAVPTRPLSWLMLAGLGGGLLWRLTVLSVWPSGVLPYVGWVMAGVGAIALLFAVLNRPRLERWLRPISLRVEEGLTVAAMVVLVPFSLSWIIRTVNRAVLGPIPWLHPQIPDWLPLVAPLQRAALLLLLALPWGVGLLLRSFGPTRPLSLAELAAHSPDGVALMRRFFRAGTEPLVLIQSEAPLILSAAHGQWNRRIFVSQGLLDRLENGAIAALLAAELAQLENRASLALPWLIGLLQLPYGLYRLFASWGNFCDRKRQSSLDAGFKLLARLGLALSGGLAALAYGVFKLWRWPLLWVSRSRTIHADRAAVDRLANPNAYGQALQAYAQALCTAVAHQGQTDPLLEAFELLLPLGLPVALTVNLGGDGVVSLADRLAWDCASPYRRWLNLNSAHPLLGDRLQRLNTYAQRAQIAPAIALPKPEAATSNPSSNLSLNPSLNLLRALLEPRTAPAKRQALRQSWALWPALLRQGAPFFGAIAGLLLGLLFWMLGATASVLGAWPLDWVLGDRNLLWGLMPMGVGLGLIVRTNSFFPQKLQANAQRQNSPAIAAQLLLTDRLRLPLAAESVEFTGTLQGRPSVGNWLGQDLLLQTDAGLLRLHWCSPLGPAGNLWPKFLRPSHLIGREVVVSGWLRRGATLWLDVEQLQTLTGGRSSQRGHPMWAAVMAAIAVLWGSLILLRMA